MAALIEEHEAELRGAQAQTAAAEERYSQALQHGLAARGQHGAPAELVAELEARLARMTSEAEQAEQRHQVARARARVRVNPYP